MVTTNRPTKDKLQDVVLTLAQLDTGERDPRKLYLKAKAVEAVTQWLRCERGAEIQYTRLAPT
jgi:hypothetical protein